MVTVVATGFNKDEKKNTEVSNTVEKKLITESKISSIGARAMDSAPRGITQLEGLDIPAIHRNNKSSEAETISTRLGNAYETKKNDLNRTQPVENRTNEKIEDKVISKIKEDNYSMYERPAFIRKMMME